MSSICFVTTCMGRISFLQQTLGNLVAQPDCSCVVVDYSCPDRCGDWVSATFPQVEVVRVTGEKLFNRSKANNCGITAAKAPWLCMIDCDVLAAPTFSESVSRILQAGSYYRAHPIVDPGISGTCLVLLEDALRAQCYDDSFEGWGEEDSDFYMTLSFLGVQAKKFPAALVQHIPHSHGLRTHHHEIKDRWANWAINNLYRIVKLDLMRLKDGLLSPKQRHNLYQQIKRLAIGAYREGHDLEFTINMGASKVLANGIHLTNELKYKLARPKGT